MNERIAIKTSLSLGILGVCWTFVGIATSIAVHPKWWWTHNALSDLGAIWAKMNYLYNSTMIVGGALGAIGSYGITKRARNVLGISSGILLGLSFIWLLLIGVFPEGTSPHFTLSWAFFLTGFVAIILYGFSAIIADEPKYGIFSVSIASFGWFFAMAFHWSGTAIKEIIGAFVIAIWYLVTSYRYLKEVAKDRWENVQ